MCLARIMGVAVLAALSLGAEPVHGNAEGSGRASKLSAALGGALDSEMGESSGHVQELARTPITLKSGRSDDYRRRVASDLQALRSTDGRHHLGSQ